MPTKFAILLALASLAPVTAISAPKLVGLECSASLTRTVTYTVLINLSDPWSKQAPNTMGLYVDAKRFDDAGKYIETITLESSELKLSAFTESPLRIQASAVQPARNAAERDMQYSLDVEAPPSSDEGYTGSLSMSGREVTDRLHCSKILLAH